MSLKLASVTFDCHDAAVVAAFWAEALGRSMGEGPGPAFAALPAGEPGEPALMFFAVPEGKEVKNRLHFDLATADRDAEVARLAGLGATKVDDREGAGFEWTVMTDPEGNEFCVVTRSTAG